MAKNLSPDQVRAEIWGYYYRSGYIRRPRGVYLYLGNQRTDWEVRFLLRSKKQLRELQYLLGQAGFTIDEPFRRFGLHMQPLYGQEAVEQFMALVRDPPNLRLWDAEETLNAMEDPSPGI